MKKLLLLLIGMGFAFAFTSCDDQESIDKKCQVPKLPKHIVEKERHHKRW
jgi:hypothetical protein